MKKEKFQPLTRRELMTIKGGTETTIEQTVAKTDDDIEKPHVKIPGQQG